MQKTCFSDSLDISFEQFSLIEGDLLTATKKTQPRHIAIYDIFCAVLYRLQEGCRRRSLDRILQELVLGAINGREAQTTLVIVDLKSIKNTDTAEEKGYEAGKNFHL